MLIGQIVNSNELVLARSGGSPRRKVRVPAVICTSVSVVNATPEGGASPQQAALPPAILSLYRVKLTDANCSAGS